MNVVDRLVMNLPHLLGNYEKYSKAEEIIGEKVPQTTLRFPVDSFLLIWEFLIMHNENIGHSILALYR